MEYIDLDGQILTIKIIKNSTWHYYNSKGQFHRLDGPAREWCNGGYDWYKNDRPHRIGGPAYYNAGYNHYVWLVNNRKVEVYYICG